jgi:hypothetical protein
MSEIVTDEEVEEALINLNEHARKAAKAIAYAGYMDKFSEVTKARLMGKCNESTVAAQERFALAHADYEVHLKNKQTAVEKAKEEEFLLKAKAQVIDVWKALQYRNKRIESI